MSWKLILPGKKPIVWEALDDFAEQELALFGLFAKLEPTDAAGNVKVRGVSRDELVNWADASDWQEAFCMLRRPLHANKMEIALEATTFETTPHLRYARMRELFYSGLAPVFSADCMPLHAGFAKRGKQAYLFLGAPILKTMRRLGAEWEILADDAVLVCAGAKQFTALPLPTWQAGAQGTPRHFADPAQSFPLSGCVALLGARHPAWTKLGKPDRYPPLIRAVRDIFRQLDPAWPADPQRKRLSDAFRLAVQLADHKNVFLWEIPSSGKLSGLFAKNPAENSQL